MAWKRRADGSMGESDGLEDVEFKPEEFKKDIDKTVSDKFTAFGVDLDAKMKPMLDMAASIAADKEERRVAAEAAKRKTDSERNEVTDEDFLLDPMGAVEKKLAPTQRALATLAAKGIKNDVLAEREYYHGDLKSKIDAMINAQPLNAQLDPNVIDNCYKVVCFDHQKDIQDGKIKSKNQAATFESQGGRSHKGTEKSDDVIDMSTEEKEVASKMGISDKDWMASKRELTYV